MLHHRAEHNHRDAPEEPLGAAHQRQGETLLVFSIDVTGRRDEWLRERAKDSMFPSSCLQDQVTNSFVCLCHQRGTYLPQTYIIQEEMMVTGRVRNMRQLGPFIHRLCYGKETYRLRRRNQRRREYTSAHAV